MCPSVGRPLQYLLFACDPYETIGFKVPNLKIDKQEGRFFTNWEKDAKKFTVRMIHDARADRESDRSAFPIACEVLLPDQYALFSCTKILHKS